MLIKTIVIAISFIPLLAAQNGSIKPNQLKDDVIAINVTQRNISNPINKICPVKDLPVKAKVQEIIYENMIIGFCCKGCDEVFLNNPKFYENKLKLKNN